MKANDPDLFQARIQAVLQEVQFIRQEILDNITREFQLHISTVTIYGAIIAFAFQQKEPQVLLISPIIAWAFTVLWMTCKKHLDASSFYLQEMEKSKWVDLIGKRDGSGSETCQSATKRDKYQQYWVSWQHFHDRTDMLPSILMGFTTVAAILVIGIACFIIGLVVPRNPENPDLRLYFFILDVVLLVSALLMVIIHVTSRNTSDYKRAIG